MSQLNYPPTNQELLVSAYSELISKLIIKFKNDINHYKAKIKYYVIPEHLFSSLAFDFKNFGNDFFIDKDLFYLWSVMNSEIKLTEENATNFIETLLIIINKEINFDYKKNIIAEFKKIDKTEQDKINFQILSGHENIAEILYYFVKVNFINLNINDKRISFENKVSNCFRDNIVFLKQFMIKFYTYIFKYIEITEDDLILFINLIQATKIEFEDFHKKIIKCKSFKDYLNNKKIIIYDNNSIETYCLFKLPEDIINQIKIEYIIGLLTDIIFSNMLDNTTDYKKQFIEFNLMFRIFMENKFNENFDEIPSTYKINFITDLVKYFLQGEDLNHLDEDIKKVFKLEITNKYLDKIIISYI